MLSKAGVAVSACLFQISGIQECKHIHDLHLLRELKLMGNPVQVTGAIVCFSLSLFTLKTCSALLVQSH